MVICIGYNTINAQTWCAASAPSITSNIGYGLTNCLVDAFPGIRYAAAAVPQQAVVDYVKIEHFNALGLDVLVSAGCFQFDNVVRLL